MPDSNTVSARQSTPVAMTIAGSDSGGGAGIQADLKTFSALGVYGTSTITALTAQNTCTVSAIHEVPPAFIVEQLHAVLSDINVRAIKIGMLASAVIIEAVADTLKHHASIPIVLDPVMVAKSGDALLQHSAIDALSERLLPMATLITPNLPEMALLSGCTEAHDPDSMRIQAQQLSAKTATAVLLKGGHLNHSQCTDLLIIGDTEHRFTHPRIDTGNTHGTGCTLSSAIAAYLSHGYTLPKAVAQATDYVHAAIDAGRDLGIGQGHGPVHHFHGLWANA